MTTKRGTGSRVAARLVVVSLSLMLSACHFVSGLDGFDEDPASGTGGGGGGGSGGEGGTGGIDVVTYREAVMGDMPSAYWRLGESSGTIAGDELGINDGSYQGAPTLGVAGALAEPDTAVRFDALGQRVDVGNVFSFADTAPFTVELWIRFPNEPLIEDGFIIHKSDGMNGWRVAAEPGADGPGIRMVRQRDGVDEGVLATNISTNAWHHVAATYDGMAMLLYIDGQRVGPRNTTVAMLQHAQPLQIGAAFGQFQTFAVVDEVAVYDRALEQDAIVAHAEAAE